MRKNAKKAIVVTLSLLILSACGSVGTENIYTTTVESTMEEITAEEIVESAIPTETPAYKFNYEVEYSGGWLVEGVDEDGFLLITSREELENLVVVNQELNEKYNQTWFETHALVAGEWGHASCDRAVLNRIEVNEKTMVIFIDIVHSEEEELYKNQGKDYERSDVGRGEHTAAEGGTYFFIETDKEGEAFAKGLKAAMVRVRNYPSSKWRAGLINLGKEE